MSHNSVPGRRYRRPVALFREYVDPTLVGLYDRLNPHGADTDFYLGLATELAASTVLDVGCGTGLLASALARQGHQVTGVDPAPAMIDFARSRPDADGVRWEHGDVGQLAGLDADLAVLTGHVCQVITDDGSWLETLEGVHAALRPGGRVAFESRNPGARIWLDWTPEATLSRIPDGAGGWVETWKVVTGTEPGHVRFDLHYRFLPSGEEIVSAGALRFRTLPELTRSLAAGGFDVEQVFGDWDRRPAAPDCRELIVLASGK